MAKYRILLADSNNQFQTTVRDYLTAQEGIERVDTVNDGQSALDAMNNNRYDVLLCDLIMPGMDGFELLERLNSGLVKDCLLYTSLSPPPPPCSRVWWLWSCRCPGR